MDGIRGRLPLAFGLLLALLLTSTFKVSAPSDSKAAAVSAAEHDCREDSRPCAEDHSSSDDNTRQGDLDDFDSALPHLHPAWSPVAFSHDCVYSLRLCDGFSPRLNAPPDSSLRA